MGVNITTIAYLRVLIIEIGSTIIFNGGGSPGVSLYVAQQVPQKVSRTFLGFKTSKYIRYCSVRTFDLLLHLLFSDFTVITPK